MALKDYYNTGDDNQSLMSSASVWFAQSFIASESYDAALVKIKIFKDAGVTGTMTVSIRAASGDNPTGGDLASGTLDLSTVTDTSAPGDWYEITLSSPVSLTMGNQYAIVVRDDTALASYWRGDFSSPTLANGSSRFSTNSGSTWMAYGSGDFMFEIHTGASYIDLSASIEDTSEISGTLEIDMYIALSANLEDTSEISGTLTIGINWKADITASTKRLIALGNNSLYYEDI